MAIVQVRAFARAHARLERSSRASWMDDARLAIWSTKDDFASCVGELRGSE